MNYLLDTSALIWTLTETEKLSPAARKIVEDPSVVKHVSAISFLEISIKISIGKLKLSGIEYNSLPGFLYERGAEIIVLEPLEAISLHRLPAKDDHRDPFDRMLICQAIERNLTLISPDKRLSQYTEYGLSLVW